MQIATDIQANLKQSELIEKTQIIGGYLNFYLNKNKIVQEVIKNLLKNGYKPKDKNNKVMCIDYSSVNLAKYMHIGHWATTIIG